MENSNSTIIVITSVTGLVGALTGLASIWINYLHYTRDNIKVKVKALKNMKTFIPGEKVDDTSYLIITAANAGRRPVTINKAAFVNLKIRGGAISSGSMMMGAQILTEGKAIDYMMDEADIDYDDISHVAVYDSVGNEYKYYLAPWYKRFLYWFLDITHIRRKPVEAPKKQRKE